MNSTSLPHRRLVLGAALLLGLAAAIALAFVAWQRTRPQVAGPVRVIAQPARIWIEASETAQTLNFDFVVENLGLTPLGIDRIELTVYDASDRPVLRRFLDSNGFAPGIETVPRRVVAPGERTLVFNPFHSFRPDADLHRLRYKFSLSIPNQAPDTEATVVVEPRIYEARTALQLPVRGKLLIHDGHDFYAHHRRLDTESAAAREVGLTSNFMRYALDINPTTDDFEPFRGTGASNADWHAWGRQLHAPGDGSVVAASDGQPDNILGGASFFDAARVKTAPMSLYGNHLVIDHGNGEYSLLAHLQRHSLSVKVGDKVLRGAPVARIGNSGSSHNPHLHYELRDGMGLRAEGLPAIFRDFARRLGAKVVDVPAGPVDTGDLLEAR